MKKGKLVLLVVGAIVFALTYFSSQSDARVDVSVGINIPAYSFAAPPPLVVIPGTYAYFVPDIDVDVFFYHGYWYRPYEGRWFRARGYNGPWAVVAPARVPRVFIDLPPDYRHIHPGHQPIPYREFNRNWRRWERDKYWERHEWWREGRRAEKHEEHRGKGRHD